MISLGLLHYIYIAMVLVIIITMGFKKDTVLPCIIGLFIIGYVSSGSIVKAVQVIFNSLIASGKEFWSIITIISLVVAMSRALRDIGADELMMSPIKKLMINKNVAFWSLGVVMTVVSLIIWPSPAVALVGAIMLPAALKVGLPAVWAASAMNLFGHGIALSGDYFIQGAPSITAKAAGLKNASSVISASIPLWITMSIVTTLTAFFMMRRDLKNCPEIAATLEVTTNKTLDASFGTTFVAFATPLAFLLDAYLMFKYELRGGDSTALIGGTAVIIMSVVAVIEHKFSDSFEKVTDYIRDGFTFGIKIFAPVVVIGAFFFLGSEGMAKEVLGPNATGLLTDIGSYLAQKAPLSKFPVVLIQAFVGAIIGLDGSGFAGLPLVGSLAQTFSQAISINKEGLAALGQISTVWVGGGTIIPWGVIPVAAICGVEPLDLVRKNMIPVMVGFAATIIVAMIIL
ncbi:hypothetical protein [Clostridium sp. HMP27]|uniref:hypothetical protein n=1 Tax=Clostridium sp. HMP27 TaxID=1487921 RepID=UPI00052D115B|nr:hypothetical protein [Clostridium sp. HMP27]KGK86753.1 membrane protein [Clostridium sp. HMP27]